MISVKGIQKTFGTNHVLKGIDLSVHEGEVLALIGGNGAGKSTLMKIIMGIYQPDAGEIYIEDKKVVLNKPSQALTQGIYLVPQEPMLFQNMTIEENVLMGFCEKKSKLIQELKALINQLGWRLDLSRKAESLSIAEQQLVEILRGLMRRSKILILDEPTSSLTFNEVQSLFEVIQDLKTKGISMIYITHRLPEVFQIATHVAIMRDGRITLSGNVGNFTQELLVKGLLPTSLEGKKQAYVSKVFEYEKLAPVLKVENLSGYGFESVSFEVYPGEIVGLAGVVGAGRTELATTLFGKDQVKSGSVYLGGVDVTGLTTKKMMNRGLNYVPEDRFLNGIFRISSVAINTTAGCLDQLHKGLLDFEKEEVLTDKYVHDFRTQITEQDQLIEALSGGNQQKVVLARALSTKPKVLILDEPTRGIDAAARGDVYKIIHQLREEGLAILLISSDMEEIIELCDRALTMYRGKVNCTFSKEEIKEDYLMAASFGVYKGGKGHE